jgi:hypothetical protein
VLRVERAPQVMCSGMSTRSDVERHGAVEPYRDGPSPRLLRLLARHRRLFHLLWTRLSAVRQAFKRAQAGNAP